MADELAHRGVKIDTEKLSAMLGVPIFPVSAKTGSGIAKALDALADPPCSAPCPYSAKAICDAVLTAETYSVRCATAVSFRGMTI